MYIVKWYSEQLDSNGNNIAGILKDIDEVKRVFKQTVCTRYDSPARGITKSWIIPDNLIISIEEV